MTNKKSSGKLSKKRYSIKTSGKKTPGKKTSSKRKQSNKIHSNKKSRKLKKDTLTKQFNDLLYKPIESQSELDKLYDIMDELEMMAKSDSATSLFPSIYDPSFSAKIAEMEKFSFFKTNKDNILGNSKKLTKEYDDTFAQKELDDKVDISDKFKTFHTSSSQNILKNFMSPYSPYRSLLVIHGTGVGKTCTAITIAENLKKMIKSSGKKIYIVRDQEFQSQLFEINKIKTGKKDKQCTKNTYVDAIDDSVIKGCQEGNEDDCKLAQLRVKKILDNYYVFEGVEKWTKNIYNKIYSTNDKLSPQEKHIYMIRKVRDLFNNSLLIIDEAHHINAKTPDSKLIATVLNDVLLYSENLRLILLTATPMFDKPQDIQSLINYMLINDKRAPIREDLFDSNGMFIIEKKDIYIEKTRGYISYLRGNSPFTFPLRLPSSVNIPKSELFDITKYPSIPDKFAHIKHKMSFLELINCPMSKEQKEIYNKVMESENKSIWNDETQCSNFIYSTFDDLGSNEYSPDLCYGKKGFNLIMKDRKNNNDSYKFKNEEYGKRFLPENIKKYSAKIYKIIKNLEKSCEHGPAFIYTSYLDGGVKPLIIALEMAGYTPYKSHEFIKNKYKINDPKKGQYIMKTGFPKDLNFKPRVISDYLSKRHSMVNSNVKIFIGSSAASEGLSLFGYREVHILEPHFNLSKLEQAIGRPIRNESHSMLPINKRNVSVYLYAATVDKVESIDLFKYRNSEMKAISTGIVEKLSKENSIDCFLQYNNNIYTHEHFPKDVNITTSFGKNIKYSLTDQPYSRICHYMSSCGYKCLSNREPKKSDGNLMFYDVYSIVEEFVIEIYKLLIEYNIITTNNIYTYLKINKDKYEELVNIAIQLILDENINKNKKIYTKNGKIGKVIRVGNQLKLITDINDKLIHKNKLLLPAMHSKYNEKVELKSYINELKNKNVKMKQLEKLRNIESNYEVLINEFETKYNEYTSKTSINNMTNISLKDHADLVIFLLFNNEILNNRYIIMNNIVKKYIKNDGDGTLNDIERKLFNYFKHENLLIKYKELISDGSYTNNKVIGYVIADNKGLKIYLYDKDDLTQDDGNRKKILERKKRDFNVKLKVKELIEIHGISFPKFADKKPEFKVSDPSSFKRVKDVYGGNCQYKKKDEIVEIINEVLEIDTKSNKLDIDISQLAKEKSRNILCNDLQIILASKNIESRKHIFYLSPEDYYLKIYN